MAFDCGECAKSFESLTARNKHYGIKHPDKPPKEGLTESYLQKHYIERNKSMVEIAEQIDSNRKLVSKWLGRHGIEKRSSSEQLSIARDSKLRDKEWLHEQYHKQGRSAVNISEEVGVSHKTVVRWLENHNIRVRDQSEVHGVPHDSPLRDEEWMKETYETEGRSINEIAEMVRCGGQAVYSWLKRHGIERRDSGYPDTPSGEENPNWKGGYTSGYGSNWPEQRQRRLEKDDHQCVVCGMSNGEHRERHNRSLHVHHIQRKEKFRGEDGALDYERANRLENLVTLCYTCHGRWEGVPLRPQ